MRYILLLTFLLSQAGTETQLQPTFGTGVWVRQGTVLSPTIAWEAGNVSEPKVLARASGCQIVASPCFGMWYTGGGFSAASAIGYAESVDGKTGWTKYSGNPVLANHDRGDIYHESTTLYLLTKNEGTQNIDLYTSPDSSGVTWTLNTSGIIAHGSAGQFDQDAAENSTIIKNGSTYDVVYEGRKGSGMTAVFQCGDATASSISGPYTKDAGNPSIPAAVCGAPFLYQAGGGALWLWNHGDVNVQPEGFPRWTSSTISGPWIRNPATNTFYGGIVFFAGSNDEAPYPGGIADGSRIETGGLTYMYYTGSNNEFAITGNQHIKLAIASVTLATIITGIEGMTSTGP